MYISFQGYLPRDPDLHQLLTGSLSPLFWLDQAGKQYKSRHFMEAWGRLMTYSEILFNLHNSSPQRMYISKDMSHWWFGFCDSWSRFMGDKGLLSLEEWTQTLVKSQLYLCMMLVVRGYCDITIWPITKRTDVLSMTDKSDERPLLFSLWEMRRTTTWLHIFRLTIEDMSQLPYGYTSLGSL